jgi:integrase
MRPVAARGRQPNAAYRVREHLTEDEMARLLVALKRNRHGQRDWLIGLLIYRHGLRVSEACDLRWDDIDLPKRTIIVRRLKGSHRTWIFPLQGGSNPMTSWAARY